MSPIKFFEQVKQEALKVVWPEKKELMQSVAMVLLVVLVVGLLLVSVDYVIHSCIKFLLSIG